MQRIARQKSNSQLRAGFSETGHIIGGPSHSRESWVLDSGKIRTGFSLALTSAETGDMLTKNSEEHPDCPTIKSKSWAIRQEKLEVVFLTHRRPMVTKSPHNRDPSPVAKGMIWAHRITTISLEMVGPGILGYWLDEKYNTKPWLFLGGTVFGFSLALYHLVRIGQDSSDNSKKPELNSTNTSTDNPPENNSDKSE